MALTREQKAKQLREFKECLSKAKSVAFLQYAGTNVEAISELRTKLYEKKAHMKVGKKTLFRLAAREAGLPELKDEHMPQDVAFLFSNEDEISGPKVAFEFGKVHDKVKIVGGILSGSILSRMEAIELGKMLSREQLLQKFLMMLQTPLSNFAFICSSPLRSFAYGVKQIAEQRASSSSA